jgi:putative flippase GtrA
MTTDVVLPIRPVPPEAAPKCPAETTSECPPEPARECPPRPAAKRPWPQLLRFAGVGLASTAGYALLYLLLRPLIGPFAANALALLLTAIANTAANRRVTFGVRGRSGVFGDHAVGLLAFGAGLILTSGALAGLHAISDPARSVELLVLMFANALATLLRFVVLKLTFDRRTAILT